MKFIFAMDLQTQKKSISSKFVLGLLVATVAAGGSVNAATIFDFTKNSAINSPSESFTSGDVTLTLQNSNSSGELNNNTLNFNKNGLCAFAAVGTSEGRCGYGSADPNGGITEFQAVFNKSVLVNSYEVTDFSSSFLNSVFFEVSLDNNPLPPFSITSTGTVIVGGLPVQANQAVFIRTSGNFSTLNETGIVRINSLNVTDVPGPLGVMGVASAIAWSKQLKKRTKSL